MIRRHFLSDALDRHLTAPDKILILEGVRQTGKTTAIQVALQGRPHTLVTLSDETFEAVQVREAKTFEELRLTLKRNYHFEPGSGTSLVIDEAQRSHSLYNFIMQMAREWRGTPIILSGSVMGAFFKRPENKESVSPAGRVTKLTCRPFSFYEFLAWTGHNSLLAEIEAFTFEQPLADPIHQEAMRVFFEYLSSGGFPEAIARLGSTEQLYDYLQILLSLFRQDADRYLSEILESPKYQYGTLMYETLKAVAAHTSSPTKRSSLISTDSPAYRTILPALLDALEEWHFLFRLPTRMKTMTTKQGFSSKKYLWDTGVANHFLNLSRPVAAVSDPQLLSRLLENFTAQELIFYLKTRERLASWKSHQKQERELDFLASFPEQDVPFEVKTSPNQKAISQLHEYLTLHPHSPAYVVSLENFQKTETREGTIHWIPPYLLGLVGKQFQLRHKLRS